MLNGFLIFDSVSDGAHNITLSLGLKLIYWVFI